MPEFLTNDQATTLFTAEAQARQQAQEDATAAGQAASGAQQTANGKYTKPGAGIPASDIATEVTDVLPSAAEKQQLGTLASDLDGKADNDDYPDLTNQTGGLYVNSGTLTTETSQQTADRLDPFLSGGGAAAPTDVWNTPVANQTTTEGGGDIVLNLDTLLLSGVTVGGYEAVGSLPANTTLVGSTLTVADTAQLAATDVVVDAVSPDGWFRSRVTISVAVGPPSATTGALLPTSGMSFAGGGIAVVEDYTASPLMDIVCLADAETYTLQSLASGMPDVAGLEAWIAARPADKSCEVTRVYNQAGGGHMDTVTPGSGAYLCGSSGTLTLTQTGAVTVGPGTAALRTTNALAGSPRTTETAQWALIHRVGTNQRRTACNFGWGSDNPHAFRMWNSDPESFRYLYDNDSESHTFTSAILNNETGDFLASHRDSGGGTIESVAMTLTNGTPVTETNVSANDNTGAAEIPENTGGREGRVGALAVWSDATPANVPSDADILTGRAAVLALS
ncbi:MAG: hypothetical protein AAGF99_00445 [Bacteroidota bacterium]